MLKDVTEMGEIPYFIYTTTSAQNLLSLYGMTFLNLPLNNMS